jgi:hypothetical protein
MPEDQSAARRYLAEVERQLGLRALERRRALASARRELEQIKAQKLRAGAGALVAQPPEQQRGSA